MKKQLTAWLLAAGMLLLLPACGGTDPTTPDADSAGKVTGPADTGRETGPSTEEPKPDLSAFEKTVLLHGEVEGVRRLGSRYLASDKQWNADWVGSGLELVIDCKGGNLTLRTSADNPCRFRAWVDGEVWNNTDGTPYYTVNGVKNLVLADLPAGVHTVRVIRVTDGTMTLAHFFNVTFFGTLLADRMPADQPLNMEFLGADAMSGLGVLGGSGVEGADGSLAYPYLTAGALGADYAITSLAGRGLVTGTPALSAAYLLSSPLRDGTSYDFARAADFTVIDVGNADFASGVRQSAFREAYIRLLRTVSEKNGTGKKIYCVWRADDGFAALLSDICLEMGGTDAGIYTLCLPAAAGESAAAAEQQAYADALAACIRETKDAPVTDAPGLRPGEILTKDQGEGVRIGYDDPEWD